MAGSSSVTVKCQYFQACCLEGDEKTERLFDLQNWINDVEQMSIEDRIRNVNNVRGRLESIYITSDHKFYALNFMRMDDYSDAYKLKESKAAEHIELEDDEYLGRNTVAIYDERQNILMIQGNRGGYGVAAIQTYINSTSTRDMCYLRPIYSYFDAERCFKDRIARLEIRFANTRAYRPTKSHPLERIVQSINEIEGMVGRIEIGMGYNRTESLNQETIYEIVDDVRANRDAISTAKVRLDDDTKSVIFDLFQDAERDELKYNRQAMGDLRFESLANCMDRKYWSSRNRVLRSLKQMKGE